jgi:glycerophosphoryl diester phosphodiesterase
LVPGLPAENSLAAFEFALAHGCDGFEFDVRHTRDGRSVLWHDPDYCGNTIADSDHSELSDRDGSSLPVLEEVLARFGSRAFLDIELKVAGGEAGVLASLREAGLGDKVLVSSFLPDVLYQMRSLAPNLALGFICDQKETLARRGEVPVNVVLPQDRLITRALIAKIHDEGRQVMAWTVNAPSRMAELAKWGIDGIISDDPELLYQTFHIG